MQLPHIHLWSTAERKLTCFRVSLLSRLEQKSGLVLCLCNSTLPKSSVCVSRFRCVCVPSRGKGGCGGLWSCNRRPAGGGADPEPRKAEGLLSGLLPRLGSWWPVWERPGVGLLRELQSRHAVHQWWGGRGGRGSEGENVLMCPYISLIWFHMASASKKWALHLCWIFSSNHAVRAADLPIIPRKPL